MQVCHHSQSTLAPMVLAFAFVCGCSEPQVPELLRFDADGFSWIENVADPIPGIHRGAVSKVTFTFPSSGSSTVTLWSDCTGSSAVGSSGRQSARYVGDFFWQDDQTLEFELKADQSKVTLVRIGDQKFDLADGSLFLISTQSELIRVKQLKLDVSRVTKEKDVAREFALETPSVKSFFDPSSEESE